LYPTAVTLKLKTPFWIRIATNPLALFAGFSAFFVTYTGTGGLGTGGFLGAGQLAVAEAVALALA
jgi:hypothetical protein